MKLKNQFFVFVVIRIIKLVMLKIIFYLYRNGDNGYFMGASYNKSPDLETAAAGIIIGFHIYTAISLISLIVQRLLGKEENLYTRRISELPMNATAAILFVVVGASILQWWLSFIPGNHFIQTNPNRMGIIMGTLTILNAVPYCCEVLILIFWTDYQLVSSH